MSSISISYQKLNFFNKKVFRKQESLGQLKKAGPITTFMIIKKAFGIFLSVKRFAQFVLYVQNIEKIH
jgi:hypothetical protein